MADSDAVWGVDIGQAGLKAIRLRYAESADQVLAVDFDYVPHPKILSQPDAIPEELIAQAIETFLERKDVRGDRIAISVPGPTSLARFINLPPVESNKVAEIVKYEAKQQIPFALEEVIWDYQKISGSVDDESGYMLNAEVGLFAMKRDQVMECLQPFVDLDVDIDLIQIAPLGLYNFVCYDHMGVRIGEEPGGEEQSDEFTIVLDMGTDNTTLLVTNGEKIWIRNVPLGGNHFTRALTKEMKLTFTKAEHLKCNATRSPDPRAVFQALRPVFNDYVAEIQRSIGYFSSVNREAKIVRILGTGNGFKLAGLQKFLQQSLQYEVVRTETLQAAVGEKVLNDATFQDNILTFAVPYGLALQLLGVTAIRTTLLPREIAVARTVRKKKPYAVVAASIILAAMAVDMGPRGCVDRSLHHESVNAAAENAKSWSTEHAGKQRDYKTQGGRFDTIIGNQDKLLGVAERRDLIAEIYRAINECLPRDIGDQLDNEDITSRHRLHITYRVHRRYGDLQTEWFDALPPGRRDPSYMAEGDIESPPTGTGYVFTLIGHHFHTGRKTSDVLHFFVLDTLIKNLNKWAVQQPGSTTSVPVRQLGISHPVLVAHTYEKVTLNPDSRLPTGGDAPAGAAAAGGSPMGGTGGLVGGGGLVGASATNTPSPAGRGSSGVLVSKTMFRVEFVWRPTPKSVRLATDPRLTTAADGQPATGAAANNTTPPAATPPSATPTNNTGAGGS